MHRVEKDLLWPDEEGLRGGTETAWGDLLEGYSDVGLFKPSKSPSLTVPIRRKAFLLPPKRSCLWNLWNL